MASAEVSAAYTERYTGQVSEIASQMATDVLIIEALVGDDEVARYGAPASVFVASPCSSHSASVKRSSSARCAGCRPASRAGARPLTAPLRRRAASA